jgi:glycosyltransferase involved in cell wall biosynthesis
VNPASDAAARGFRAAYPDLSLPPVAVIIPALNEEDGLGGVLAAVEPSICGLDTAVIVVDDGSRDRTSGVARAHGALVARRSSPGGQGTALRVGYALAREFGAQYVVTLDADGQWDPADVPRVLEPVVTGEADFALGSRVLGVSEGRHWFRGLGVRVFSAIARLMTGTSVTDTSSGLRAFTVEVATEVPQYEPQYQSSEMLLGALLHGYRVVERPTTMHRRTFGKSRKGNDIFYGLRYAGVVLRTYLRERGAKQRRASTGRFTPPANSANGAAAADPATSSADSTTG